MAVECSVSSEVDDRALSELHRLAFGYDNMAVTAWSSRLKRHSIAWVTAHDASRLVGFVNVVGDGGEHAFIVDTTVHPDHQYRGIGQQLVAAAAGEAQAQGCEWLHVDFEEQFAEFYLERCGFASSRAGLMHLG